MISLDVGNLVFLACLLVGGGLLLVSIVFGELLDVAGGLGLDLDFADIGVVPMVLAFVALFGAGGLFGSLSLALPGNNAAYVGIGVGIAGAVGTGLAWRLFRRSEAQGEFHIDSLVGASGEVVVPITAGGNGEVSIVAMGAPRRFPATAVTALPIGAIVVVQQAIGGRLVVGGPDDLLTPLGEHNKATT